MNNNVGQWNNTQALTEELAAELKEVFKDLKLKRADGTEGEPTIYIQSLPNTQYNDDDEVGFAPYVIVMKSDFKIEGYTSPKIMKVILVFCTYDGGDQRTGDQDTTIMMDRVLERLGKNQKVGNFVLQLPIEGAWQDKDTYPFFYAAMELNFEAPTYRTEDDLA